MGNNEICIKWSNIKNKDLFLEKFPEFVDPISKDLIIEPVITVNGFMYNKSDIEEWLSKSNLDPCCNLPLSTKTLCPSIFFKNLILKELDNFKE